MADEIMATFRQKVQLNNDDLLQFHRGMSSWQKQLKTGTDQKIQKQTTLEDMCGFDSDEEETYKDSIYDLVVRGRKCLENGEWSRAISIYSSLISKANADSRFYVYRAIAFLRKHSPIEAERDCTRAIEINPNDKKGFLVRASARKRLGKYSETCNDLESILLMDPENVVVAQEYEAMVKYLHQDLVNRRSSDDLGEKHQLAIKHKNIGNNLIQKGDYKQAEEKYSLAINLNPDDETFYANRAICFMKMKKFAFAEKDCNKALELNAEYTKVLIRRSRVRRSMGKLNEALNDLSAAYELNKNDKEIQDELQEVDNLIEKFSKLGKLKTKDDCINTVPPKPAENSAKLQPNVTTNRPKPEDPKDHNMREVFPIKTSEFTGKLSGPYIKVRIEDSKFVSPNALWEIPESLKV